MDYSRKLLSSSNSTSNARAEAPEGTMNLETDFVVVVAALVCALICVLGLIVVARCAFLRRGAHSWSLDLGGGNNRGVKKKVLNSLPKYTHNTDSSGECAICLAEYGEGEVIRVLPQCGHRFHVQCIDTWLASHSSCPSCRQVLVTRCHKCGEVPIPCQAEAAGAPAKFTPISSAASTSSVTFLP